MSRVDAPTAARPPRIGLFDSGVGGLSVLSSLRQRLPQARYFYAADNAHFPYGLRSEAEVVAHTVAAASALVAAHALDLLVIACNTASTVALPALRHRLAVPVVGTVPAVKPAAEQTQTGAIGILATPGTIARAYMDDLIASHGRGVRVVRVGSSLLVELAEAKLRGVKVPVDAVKQEIAGLFAPQATGDERSGDNVAPAPIDTVVLGCTHFPLLADELAEASPWPVRWLDSGAAIAARTEALLREMPDLAWGRALVVPQPAFFCTALNASIRALAPELASWGFPPPQLLLMEGSQP